MCFRGFVPHYFYSLRSFNLWHQSVLLILLGFSFFMNSLLFLCAEAEEISSASSECAQQVINLKNLTEDKVDRDFADYLYFIPIRRLPEVLEKFFSQNKSTHNNANENHDRLYQSRIAYLIKYVDVKRLIELKNKLDAFKTEQGKKNLIDTVTVWESDNKGFVDYFDFYSIRSISRFPDIMKVFFSKDPNEMSAREQQLYFEEAEYLLAVINADRLIQLNHEFEAYK